MKTTYKLMFFIFLLVGLYSCEKKQAKEVKDKTQIIVDEDTVAMDSIMKKARPTIDIFLKALNSGDTTKTAFAVNYPFDTDPGSETEKEFIWLTDIEQEEGKYYGYLSKSPFYLSGLNIWDRMPFDLTKIYDWKYVDKGYLVGGGSLIYFYNQMTNEEKEKFKYDTNIKFKDSLHGSY
jgi:uncharacterized protein YegJ (DUF2314 family)